MLFFDRLHYGRFFLRLTELVQVGEFGVADGSTANTGDDESDLTLLFHGVIQRDAGDDLTLGTGAVLDQIERVAHFLKGQGSAGMEVDDDTLGLLERHAIQHGVIEGLLSAWVVFSCPEPLPMAR